MPRRPRVLGGAAGCAPAGGARSHSGKGWGPRGYPHPGVGVWFWGGGLARPSLGRGFRAGNAGSWQRQAAFLLTIPVHVPEASIVHVEDFDGGTRSKKCGGLFSPTLRFSRTLKTQNLNFEGTGHRVCCAGHVCTLTSFLFFVIWGFDL